MPCYEIRKIKGNGLRRWRVGALSWMSRIFFAEMRTEWMKEEGLGFEL